MNFEMANWAAVLLLLSPLILAALGWLIAAISTPLQRQESLNDDDGYMARVSSRPGVAIRILPRLEIMCSLAEKEIMTHFEYELLNCLGVMAGSLILIAGALLYIATRAK